KLPDKTLIILAGLLIFSPLLFDLSSVIFHYKNGEFLEKIGNAIDEKNGLPLVDYGDDLTKNGAGCQEGRNWQASGYLYRYSYILDSNRIPKVLAMFLIGFCVGRKMMYAQLEKYVSLFKQLRRWGFIIGLPSAFACFYFEF